MRKKTKKAIPSKVVKRDEVSERLSDPRPRSTSPTSGFRGREREGRRSATPGSPPKSRQREISWIDYEELIRARQEEKYLTSPEGSSRRTRSHSVSRSPSRSRGRSPLGTRPSDDQDPGSKHHVRFSTSAPIRPNEALPYPFLRKTSQPQPLLGPGERRQSLLTELREGEKCFEGELHIDVGRSIIVTPRVPGDEKWRDFNKEPPLLTKKLDLEGLAMKVPSYLADMRGESRQSSLRALSTFGVPLMSGHRRSAFVRAVEAVTNIDGVRGRRTSKYITIAPKARLSTVIVPVNAKQWLLQSMRLKDAELRELFDHMELIPQLAGDHVREVRAEWEALEAREMQVPPEAETLVKDKVLLDKVKSLLGHFIEIFKEISPEEELMREQIRESKSEDNDIADNESEPDERPRDTPTKGRKAFRPSVMFQGFERDREGSLSPVFGMGASLCPLCGQIKPRGTVKDNRTPVSQKGHHLHAEDEQNPRNSIQLRGPDGESQKTYNTPIERRWFTVLFPALQPGKREDVQLLGEWLRYATHRNQCEDAEGRIADVDVGFVLHSIALLEVVRQVRLQCEERGDMLLHVWRQLLRLFSQVMIRAEPKLIGMEKETSQLKENIFVDKQKIDKVTQDLIATTQKFEKTEEKLKEKELHWSQLKRCRLCSGENLTPSSREWIQRRNSLRKQGGLGSEENEGGDVGSPGSDKPHGAHGHGQHKGRGKHGDKPGDPPGGVGVDGSLGPSGEGSGAVGVQGDGLEEGGWGETGSGSLEPGEIPQGFLHRDGLHADIGVQTDLDTTGRSMFFEVLKKPISAPAKLMTAIMEEFLLASGVVHRDLEEGELEQAKKEPETTGLTAEDIAMLSNTGDDEDGNEGVGLKNSAIKMLAADTVEVLEQLPEESLDEDKAEKLRDLLSRFQKIRRSSVDGEVGGEEEVEQTASDGTKKKRSKGWGKLRKGIDEAKRRKDMFYSIASELLSRQKKPASKVTKPKDLPNIPLGFAKMMKISPPPKVIKNFNDHQLMKLIEAIYEAKIVADAVDDSQDSERQNACEFVYDFMLNSYGLKGLAESAVHGVFKKIKQLMISKGVEKTHKGCNDFSNGHALNMVHKYWGTNKLRLFQRFCGFDPLRGYTEADLYLYLKALSRAQGRLGVFFPSEGDEGMCYINAGQLDFLLEEPTLLAQFRGSKEIAADFLAQFTAANATTEKVSLEVQKIVKSPTVRKVDFDVMMEAIIEVNPHKDMKKPPKAKAAGKATPTMTQEESAALENLFIAGDANQDGVLTFNEFHEIISSADASVTKAQALRMFRETLLLMPEGGDNISPTAFATVAYSHGIKATSSVVFELLKKTWLQIQDDVNQDKMKDSVLKKECDDMRTALREMLKEKKTENVNRAVQTFQTFVLKFCGKDAAVSEAPPTQES